MERELKDYAASLIRSEFGHLTDEEFQATALVIAKQLKLKQEELKDTESKNW